MSNEISSEVRQVLAEAVEQGSHAEGCKRGKFQSQYKNCPPAHPVWKVNPPCSCWIGRALVLLNNK